MAVGVGTGVFTFCVGVGVFGFGVSLGSGGSVGGGRVSVGGGGVSVGLSVGVSEGSTVWVGVTGVELGFGVSDGMTVGVSDGLGVSVSGGGVAVGPLCSPSSSQSFEPTTRHDQSPLGGTTFKNVVHPVSAGIAGTSTVPL